MSKEKFRLENRLGSSGVITTIVLIITTIITAFLFTASCFIRIVLHSYQGMQRFLETVGTEGIEIQNVFGISRSISWLGSAPMLAVLIALIILLLVIWVSLYRINRVYIYRAFRGYGVSLICISCLLIILGLITGPVVSRIAVNYYEGYEGVFSAGKWMLIFSAVPVLALGLLMLLISLFAAFPAKTDMKRPRKNGEKDVSFIMEDEDASQSFEYSNKDKTFEKISPDGNEPSESVETAQAEIVENTCPNCGAVVNDGYVFCIECGKKL